MKQASKTVWLSRLSTSLFCSVFLICNVQAAPHTTGEPLDHIIAIVNDAPITASDLNAALDTTKKQMLNSNIPLPPPTVLRQKVLEQTINRKLQLQVAEQAGIHVSNTEVEKAIQEIAASNQISTQELLDKVSSQGMNIAAYKKEIREAMTIQQLLQNEIGAHITISPQELEDFMHSPAWKTYNGKEYHLENILIALPDNPSPEDKVAAKNRADEILAKLHKGSSFEEMTKDSAASAGQLQGGDLGWRQLPQIPSAFSSQLLHIKTGEIMGPIATPNGFHIVKLSGVRNVSNPETAAEQRKKAEQLIFQRKMEEAVQVWLTKARGAAFINMHPEQ